MPRPTDLRPRTFWHQPRASLSAWLAVPVRAAGQDRFPPQRIPRPWSGYDEQARHLTPAQKAAIRKRDNGLCARCGRPGAEIDHIDGSSDDPANLQLICLDCHHTKTRQAMTTITDPAEQAAIAVLHAELADRIDSPAPRRACDNEQAWARAWRSWPTIMAAGAYECNQVPLRFADIMAVIARADAR